MDNSTLSTNDKNTDTYSAEFQQALVYFNEKKYRLSAYACRQVLKQFPDSISTLNLLAMNAHFLQKFKTANLLYKIANKKLPDNPDLLYNQGMILSSQNDDLEAIAAYRKAIDLLSQTTIAAAMRPQIDQLYNKLGHALIKIHRHAEARENYKKALMIKPDIASAYNGLGCIHHYFAEFKQATENFDKALAINPDYVDAHFNLGLNYLVQGNFTQGWKEYEWRLQRPELIAFYGPLPYPLWQGGDLNGATLLVVSEQGFGDNIQFIRYVSLIKKQGGRILVITTPQLSRLFAQIPAIDEVSASTKLQYNINYYIPLLSLPSIFKTTLETIPVTIPYLSADDKDIQRFNTQFNLATNSLKVGICWAGSLTHKHAHNRSCTLADFMTLFDLPGITFYSLQKSLTADVIPADSPLINLADSLTDFAATAGAIAHLDLVITVDTAIAHLAGAMGKPVWNLLYFYNDWRWLRERHDSPWYPTMRLFRQTAPNDWGSVFDNIRQQLKQFKDD